MQRAVYKKVLKVLDVRGLVVLEGIPLCFEMQQ